MTRKRPIVAIALSLREEHMPSASSSADLRDAIEATMDIQRELYEAWGRWPTLAEVLLEIGLNES